MAHDKIYFNGEQVLQRENTFYNSFLFRGDRDFYCDSPLQLVLALMEVIKDMSPEKKREAMSDKFARIETYNSGTVYILVSNICSIEEHETLYTKYTSITMNSGDKHTIKCPIGDIWAILQG